MDEQRQRKYKKLDERQTKGQMHNQGPKMGGFSTPLTIQK